MRRYDFVRVLSRFEPAGTYVVHATRDGSVLGAVSPVRLLPGSRRWRASSRSWTGGGELAARFRTRRAAAKALDALAVGVPPAAYGGYIGKERDEFENEARAQGGEYFTRFD